MKRTINKRYKVSVNMDFYALDKNESLILKRVKKLEFDINKMLLTDRGTVCKLNIGKVEILPF